MMVNNIPPGAELGVLALIDLIRDPDRFKVSMDELRTVLAQTEERLAQAVELETSNRTETNRLIQLTAEIDTRKLAVENSERELDARRDSDRMVNESAKADVVEQKRLIAEAQTNLGAAKAAHASQVGADREALNGREAAIKTREGVISETKEAADLALKNADELEAKWKTRMAAIEAAAKA